MEASVVTCLKWAGTMLYLIICTITDIRKQYINTIVSLAFGIIGICLVVACMKDEIVYNVLGIVPGILIMIVSRLVKGAVGTGDGIMFIVTGIYIGIEENIVLLFYTSFLCSCVSIVLLIIRKCNKKDRLPVAPFAVCAAICTLIIKGAYLGFT